MNCDQIRDLILTEYLDGECSPEVKQKVEIHLSSCRVCAELAADARQVTVEPFIDIPTFKISSERVWSALQQQIAMEEKLPVRTSWRENWSMLWDRWVTLPRAALAGLVMGVVVIAIGVGVLAPSLSTVKQRVTAVELMEETFEELDEMAMADKEIYAADFEGYFL